MTRREPPSVQKRKILYAMDMAKELIEKWEPYKEESEEILEEAISYIKMAEYTANDLKPACKPKRPPSVPPIKNSGVSLKSIVEGRGSDLENDLSLTGDMRVPLATCDGGRTFFLNLKPGSAEGATYILGDAESAKTSFVHELILSACNCYSPDKLRFLLLSSSSEDYAAFADKDKIFSKIPHIETVHTPRDYDYEYEYEWFEQFIRYVETDVLKKIVEADGAHNFLEYNNSAAVRQGIKPELPLTVLVLDRYRHGIDHVKRGRISKLCETLGICVVILTSNVEKPEGALLRHMGNKIAMRTDSVSNIKDMFKNETDYSAERIFEELEKGETGSFAYADENGDAQMGLLACATESELRELAESIVAKYGHK
jgi:hypothetical protein